MSDLRADIMSIIRDNVFYQTGRRPTAADPMGEGWVGVDIAAGMILAKIGANVTGEPEPVRELCPVRAKALELALSRFEFHDISKPPYALTFALADRFMAYLTNTHEEDASNVSS